MEQPSDIEIARSVEARPIIDIARGLGIPERYLRPYGREIAKVSLDYLSAPAERPPGRLILVTAVSPTPAGEGKTTTAVGLTDGLNRLGKQAMVCLREPSLGPSFGMKGGAAGGGYAQVIPMEEINLHFTGDFHAIGAAHNLLAALIDNHIYWRNELGFDFRRVAWRRVLDLNDRSLRAIVSSLGGVANGFPRETGFDITAASEVMAIFCLAENLAELERRLARVVIGYTRRREPLRAGDLEAQGPMTALLKDAFAPNLVQTLEGNPAFIHGGPFANIAHGCNSVIATRAALGLADYVVTEAGFGADLGAEKFFDIKCRSAGFRPDAAVLVATARALKYHGGVARGELGRENLPALEKGLSNLRRHIRNLAQFGVPVVVAVNRFADDSDAEIKALTGYCKQFSIEVIESRHWSEGGAGAETLAAAVAKLAASGASCFVPLYDDDLPLWEKARTIARRLYGADDIIGDQKIRDRFRQLAAEGYGGFPVCMAKTQYSFSTDPNLRGAPRNHVVPIRDVRLAAGAGFVVALCGGIMTMPGLPREPAARQIRLDEKGEIQGLF